MWQGLIFCAERSSLELILLVAFGFHRAVLVIQRSRLLTTLALELPIDLFVPLPKREAGRKH
jgi:hypothetical protein